MIKVKYIRLLLFFLFSYTNLVAQDYNKEKTEIKRLLDQAFSDFNNAQYDKALESSKQALINSFGINDDSYIAQSYNTLGVIYNECSDSKKAIEFYLKALSYAKKTNKVKLLNWIYGNIGSVYYYNLNDVPKGLNYYKTRKIELDSIKNFKLGYSEKQQMVTVPVYSHTNVCVGFVGRSIEGKSFKNSTGLPRNKVLFNLNNVKYKNIAIVESSFDVIRLWQLNIPAVATLGATLGKNQIELLRKYSTGIVLASDQDQAGMELERKLYNSLKEKHITKIAFPDGIKDIGDMSDEQILTAFKSVASFDIALSF